MRDWVRKRLLNRRLACEMRKLRMVVLAIQFKWLQEELCRAIAS